MKQDGKKTAKRPNVIFYFVDQQRHDTCGCYGQPLDVTPHLDRLAREGTCFDNAFTCQPVCGPARACLQSGVYATQTGCYRNAIHLPVDIPTLAKSFSNGGYDTAYIGKWHLATTRPTYTTLDPSMPEYETKPIPREYMGGYDTWMAADVLEFTSHGYNGYVFDEKKCRHDFIGYRADAINNYAIDYIHRHDPEKPFFLFISQIEPHHQNDHHHYEGPDGSKKRFRDFVPPADLPPGRGDWEQEYPDYLGQIHALDENVGRLRDTLEEMGLWENTVILYTSDHGSHFCTRNGEYKRSCHDASTHIPLIAAGGPFQGRGHVKEMVSLMDIPRTLLDAASILPPEEFQGQSLLDLFLPDAVWQAEEVFMQISESQVGRAIRTPRYTYSVRAEADGWTDACSDTYYEEFLYDNQSDPAQQHNLSADPQYASLRVQLAERLIQRMIAAGEKKPVILPAKAW